MKRHVHHSFRSSASSRPPRTIARAAAWGFALGVLLAANGCGVSLFGHRIGGGPASPTARATHDSNSTKPAKTAKRAEHASASRATKHDADARSEMIAHPQDPYWPFKFAEECLSRDSVAEAETALRASLERDGAYAPALSALSKLSTRAVVTRRRFRCSIRRSAHPTQYPDDTRQILLTGLALHHDALGRPDLARQSVAAMPRPELKRSRSALVYVTLRGEARTRPRSSAEKALDADSRSAVNLNNFGITRLRAGDPEAAKKAFDGSDRARPIAARPLLQPHDPREVLRARRRRRGALVPRLLEALARAIPTACSGCSRRRHRSRSRRKGRLTHAPPDRDPDRCCWRACWRPRHRPERREPRRARPLPSSRPAAAPRKAGERAPRPPTAPAVEARPRGGAHARRHPHRGRDPGAAGAVHHRARPAPLHGVPASPLSAERAGRSAKRRVPPSRIVVTRAANAAGKESLR